MIKSQDLYAGIAKYDRLYQPILNSFGHIIIQIDDQKHSGDSRILYLDESYSLNKYGILVFGWGSCSGCDALQSCESFEEIDSLIVELNNKILWFDSKSLALNYFLSHDWKGDFDNSPESNVFQSLCISFLGSSIA